MSDQVILWAIVIGYMAFIFVKGVLKVRAIGTSDDYLVAGRNVGWFALFCTMGATVIGGGYSIGAIGKTYEWGVLMLLVSTGGYFHFIFSGLVVAPKFREARLYTVAGYFGHRYGEGPRFLMLILSLLFSVFIVAAQMAAFGSVTAAILPDLAEAGQMLRWAIILGGTLVVIYSTAGGLMAVIHTDLFQFLVLLAGFFITLAFCIPDIAGSWNAERGTFVPARFGASDFADPRGFARELLESPDQPAAHLRSLLDDRQKEKLRDALAGKATPLKNQAIAAVVNDLLEEPGLYEEKAFAGVPLIEQTRERIGRVGEGRELRRLNLSLVQDAWGGQVERNRTIQADFYSIEGGKGWIFLITTFLAFLLGETFAPGYATRYCVGKDVRNTRIGIAGVGFFLALTFPAVLFFIALYARIQYPDIEPQEALPMVVRALHSPIIGGLIIGALLMAVMSSADSALNSATAIFVKDLFEHQLGWEDKGDGRILRLARICTAGLGIAAILIAVLWSDIIELLLFTYHVWAPAVILPVTVGALSRRRSPGLTRNIFITMLAATGLTLVYRVLRWAYEAYGWDLFSEGTYGTIQQFDPAIFGVFISCLVFFGLTLWTGERLRGGE